MSDSQPSEPVSSQPAEPVRGWAELLHLEDYWAIWLAFLVLLAGVVLFLSRPPADMREQIADANRIMAAEADRAPFRTVAWYEAGNTKSGIKATSASWAKGLARFIGKPHGWKSDPLESLVLSEAGAERKNAAALPAYNELQAEVAAARQRALSAETAAAMAGFGDEELNAAAVTAIDEWRVLSTDASSAKKKTTISSHSQILNLIGLALLLGIFFGIGGIFMGYSFRKFVVGFLFVFGIAALAYLASEQATMKAYGIGYAAWAILFGLLISNTVGTPEWVKPAVQTEYFIKTGLVLLGAEILFGKILAIGVPGIFVSWVVTPIVLVTTFIFGQKVVKIPSKTLNITVSADMSVCGVSAAIATAAACRAKKEELTLAVGMSLVFTSIMMIVMPAFIKAVGIPEILGGAWMGGTIDATGAVAAAGAFLGERALYVAATIKMIQNVLIGVIAFGVAIYWCARVECAEGQRVSAWEIWHRFPKFVIGFIAASIIFSSIYAALGPDAGYTLIDQGVIGGLTKNLRGWFFCLAFVSIGLATNFRELGEYFKGGKPLILYVCGQSFNLILTLSMAYLMFYLVFTKITATI
jgi:uncharacterized membrane protein YadS